MKQLLSTVFFIIFFSVITNAQHVWIKDKNFATYLRSAFPSSMSGDTLNAGTTEVQTAKSIVCPGYLIRDLNGVQYFISLQTLDCHFNLITTFPTLPTTLQSLNCSSNAFTTLPTLPTTLQSLNCSFNALKSMSALPASLTFLICSNNSSLAALPALPSTLQSLICAICGLTALPALPQSLTYLDCGRDPLTSLPVLPSSLYLFNCSFCQLTSLPSIPNSLVFLGCTNNKLTSLPDLSKGKLRQLICYQNQITALPLLPATLTYLSCGYNNLTKLTGLPNGLDTLMCNNNVLDSLPVLPTGLHFLQCNNDNLTHLPNIQSITVLNCSNNNLGTLTNLPALLGYLYCSNDSLSSLTASSVKIFFLLYCDSNKLKTLPAVPINKLYCKHNLFTNLPAITGLAELDVSNNRLTGLLALPATLNVFLVSNNPNLYCMPYLQNYTGTSANFSIAGTGIKCLPAKISHSGQLKVIDTIPICTAVPPPTISSSAGTLICSANTTTLTVNTGYHYYQWSNGATTQSISGIGNGKYIVTAFNGCGLSGIDSISIVQQPTCVPPANIIAKALLPNSLNVSWTVQPCTYATQVHYRVAGTSTWSITGVKAPANIRNIKNLQGGTKYELQLRSGCDSVTNDYSPWTAIQDVTTIAVCNPPTNVTAGNLQQTRATISWTAVAGAYSYKLRTRLKGSTAWTNRVILAPTTAKVLTGLTVNTAYEYQVQTICDVSGTPASNFTAIQSFTTTLRMEQSGQEVNDLILYPNPASEQLTISSEQLTGSELMVTDILGRIYLDEKVTVDGNTKILDVSNLAEGVYFVTLKAEKGSEVRKFVKE